jgi:hypothetical protein
VEYDLLKGSPEDGDDHDGSGDDGRRDDNESLGVEATPRLEEADDTGEGADGSDAKCGYRDGELTPF